MRIGCKRFICTGVTIWVTMLLLKTHHDNMGSHMVAFTRGTALDRLAFSRTGHLYMRQYKRGREGSVLSNTAAWDRVEVHPQGAQKHL